ncbi:hypothetical protein Trydic_g13124 [Trypoxylus dichotomus]
MRMKFMIIKQDEDIKKEKIQICKIGKPSSTDPAPNDVLDSVMRAVMHLQVYEGLNTTERHTWPIQSPGMNVIAENHSLTGGILELNQDCRKYL